MEKELRFKESFGKQLLVIVFFGVIGLYLPVAVFKHLVANGAGEWLYGFVLLIAAYTLVLIFVHAKAMFNSNRLTLANDKVWLRRPYHLRSLGSLGTVFGYYFWLTELKKISSVSLKPSDVKAVKLFYRRSVFGSRNSYNLAIYTKVPNPERTTPGQTDALVVSLGFLEGSAKQNGQRAVDFFKQHGIATDTINAGKPSELKKL